MSGFLSVCAYAPDGVTTFGLGLVGEVFASRATRGLPPFDLSVCTDRPGLVRTDMGLTVQVRHRLTRLAKADLVLLLPGSGRHPPNASRQAIRAIRKAHENGAIIASHCVGAFLLADTGLLDGLHATTHWLLATEFGAKYPKVTLTPHVLYVDEGRLVTSAGAAAGIDMYLHLLRREHGAAVANAIAREVVVAPHRHGGQAQYISTPVPADTDDERLATVMYWARSNLREHLTIADLARRTLMSPRTFARRFLAATGTTPHAWLLNQRLDRAEELLETTDLGVEEVAECIGYSSAAVLREQFVKRRGVPPMTYRTSFHH
jgi:transcriptional regulator GlxA family with amidase domain